MKNRLAHKANYRDVKRLTSSQGCRKIGMIRDSSMIKISKIKTLCLAIHHISKCCDFMFWMVKLNLSPEGSILQVIPKGSHLSIFLYYILQTFSPYGKKLYIDDGRKDGRVKIENLKSCFLTFLEKFLLFFSKCFASPQKTF